MARITLTSPIRTGAGEVTTIAALADRGEIRFERVEHFMRRGGSVGVAYFAVMRDGGCWEIGKTAYESRTGQAVSLGRERLAVLPDGSRCGWDERLRTVGAAMEV